MDNNLIRIPASASTTSTTTTTSTSTTSTTIAPSPIEPQGLIWPRSDLLSNSKNSKDIVKFIGISDFNIFNPYIHYTNTGSEIKFSTSGFLIAATQRFEAYSSQFRNYNNPFPPSTTTTTTLPPLNDCITTVLEDIGGNRYAVWCVDRYGNKTRIIEYT
jgi:hypothetical protein